MNARTEMVRPPEADDGQAAGRQPETDAPRGQEADATRPRVSVDPMQATDRYRLSLPGADTPER